MTSEPEPTETVDLDEMERLAADASPGEWSKRGGTDWRAANNYLVGMTNPDGRGNGLADREFIIALHNSFPTLLALARLGQEAEKIKAEQFDLIKRAAAEARVSTLQAENEKLRAALRDLFELCRAGAEGTEARRRYDAARDALGRTP